MGGLHYSPIPLAANSMRWASGPCRYRHVPRQLMAGAPNGCSCAMCNCHKMAQKDALRLYRTRESQSFRKRPLTPGANVCYCI